MRSVREGLSLSCFNVGKFSASGDSDVVRLSKSFDIMAIQVNSDSSSTGVSVSVLGSLDGVNFVEIGGVSGTGNVLSFISGKPVKFVKFNVGSLGDGSFVEIYFCVS